MVGNKITIKLQGGLSNEWVRYPLQTPFNGVFHAGGRAFYRNIDQDGIGRFLSDRVKQQLFQVL
jgi:hypothetical protein